MAEYDSKDTVSMLRSKNQIDLHNQREKSRETKLAQSRKNIPESSVGSDVTLNEVKNLILLLKQKEKKLDVDILKKIKNSCRRIEFIEAFFKINGAFEALLCCLKSRDAQVQLEAVACFTNLACGTHKLCFRVSKSVGAYLVSFLTGSSHYLQTQCAWAVRNIANDCLECYSKLKAQGVFPALLKAVMSPMPDVVESVIYALNACLKYSDIDLIDINKTEYTNHFLNLIENQTLPSNTIREVSLILANSLYIAVGANFDCNNFNVMQLLKCLKDIMLNDNNDYLIAVILIRCLGFLTIDERIAKNLFENAMFHEIAVKILNHPPHYLKKELFWVLTNISVSHVIDIDHPLFMSILKVLGIFLNPLDSAVLSILYYICCTAVQSQTIVAEYEKQGLIASIEKLTCCGDESVENSSKTSLIIIQKNIIH